MNKALKAIATVTVIAGLATGCASMSDQKKDAVHAHDYRTFMSGGEIKHGRISDSYDAELVMYIADSQFMVMKELIQDFQKKNPNIKSVYVETIPPGKIIKEQILKQGRVDGQNTAQNPDLYASVNLKHLIKLNKQKLMSDYKIYTHNKLELMVAKGNPKKITGAKDLGRDDLVQSHPNPESEGIFKFYGTDMLNQLGLYEKVTNNAKCKRCWAIKRKTWFTSRHHIETPQRIEDGLADVGIVWSTEIIEAKTHKRAIEGVAISKELNQGNNAGYAIGTLNSGKNQANAKRYLDYLSTNAAQNIYASYGFSKASSAELKLKPL